MRGVQTVPYIRILSPTVIKRSTSDLAGHSVRILIIINPSPRWQKRRVTKLAPHKLKSIVLVAVCVELCQTLRRIRVDVDRSIALLLINDRRPKYRGY